MRGDFAIIPVRDFSSAKSRLKNELSRKERILLASQLLLRVVRATEASQIDQIIVVASDGAEARSCLRGISRLSVLSQDGRLIGVNNAMRIGIDFAISKHAETISMYPADLPLLTHEAIDSAIELARKHDIVINPSLKMDGTNFLSMNPKLQFELHYDDDSFTKHCKEAELLHYDLLLLAQKELCVDLDDASDLQSAMSIFKAESFQELLRCIGDSKI